MGFGYFAFDTGYIARSNSYYGVYDKPVLLSNLYCYGSESSLLDCNFRVPSSSCDRYDIAGVRCAGKVVCCVDMHLQCNEAITTCFKQPHALMEWNFCSHLVV